MLCGDSETSRSVLALDSDDSNVRGGLAVSLYKEETQKLAVHACAYAHDRR